MLVWFGLVAAIILGLAAMGAIIYGYLYTPGWVGVADKKVWDWLELLFVPVALAIGGFLFSRSQKNRDVKVEERRAQNDALQSYLDQMTQLLIAAEQNVLHKVETDSAVNDFLQARAQALIERFDAEHTVSLLRFMYYSGMLAKADAKGQTHSSVIRLNLAGTDLSRIVLREASLKEANFEKANLDGANLQGSLLERANLRTASLEDARLAEVRFNHAILEQANFKSARLQKARFHKANLKNTSFVNARLDEAVLTRVTSAENADFKGSCLKDTNIKYSDLSKAKNLKQEQINATTGNEETKLPPELNRPTKWSE